MARGRHNLLEDENDGEDVQPQLGFNKAYAERLEYNKKREDLFRLQELEKKGLAGSSGDDESSSEEEDEDGLLPAPVEERIFETLAKIKKRDPTIYSEQTKFFEDVENVEELGQENSDVEAAKMKKLKPLYLKDVVARQLLDGGGIEEEEEDGKTRHKYKPPPSNYFSEQDDLKKAFLQGVREAEGEEAEDDLLRVKKRTKEELERDARETQQAIEEAEQRKKEQSIAKRLEEYFGKDDDLDDNEKFLKDYLLNKGWIDHDDKPGYPTYNDDAENISEDEAALEEQDRFEKDYNFRFEEGNNTYVKGHSRIIDDSVRKKPEARKKQRERKKERESEEQRARREELKRLKNVKKKEVLEKLSKLRIVAGVSTEGGMGPLGEEDFDEDFDPEEYDKKMKEAFGEEYYGAEDPDFVEGEDFDDIEEPDFDAEDEILGVSADGASSAGFAAIKATLEKSAGKAEKKKVKVPFEEKLLIDKHLEEYFKLDYEDMIGDLPTRFKYRTVKPNKYGLKTKDIIGLDDKELNQYVSLKKLAPYRTEEWEPRGPAPRLSTKERRKKAMNSEKTSKKMKKKKKAGVDEPIPLENTPDWGKRNGKEHAENGDGAEGKGSDPATRLSSKQRRKRALNSEVDPQKEKKEKVSETVLSAKSPDGGKQIFEVVQNSAGAKGEAKEATKKRKRKQKRTRASYPLPMSRLLSYNPPAKKKVRR